jgi:hypothetical protein
MDASSSTTITVVFGFFDNQLYQGATETSPDHLPHCIPLDSASGADLPPLYQSTIAARGKTDEAQG